MEALIATDWTDTMLSGSDLNRLSDKRRSCSRGERVASIPRTPVMD